MRSKWKYRFQMFFKYKDLMILLVERDIKLKYRRSVLGYLWSVLNPLFTMLVQAWVFTSMFSKNIQHFPVYLIIGNILFSFLRESSTQAMNSIISNASLLKKVYVPKYIFTLSKVTSSMVNLIFSLGALVIMVIIDKVPFSFWSFFSVFPILELYVFCLGLGMLLAALTVFFRDIRNIWSVVLMAWNYLTPVFYDVNSLGERLKLIEIRFNPMYNYVTMMRTLVIDGTYCGTDMLLRGLWVAFAMLLFGILVFDKTKNKFILYI